jgi:hypothetical protein
MALNGCQHQVQAVRFARNLSQDRQQSASLGHPHFQEFNVHGGLRHEAILDLDAAVPGPAGLITYSFTLA